MRIEELYAHMLLHEAVTKDKAVALAGQIIAQIVKIDSRAYPELPRGIPEKEEIVSKPVSKPSGKVLAPKGNNCVCSSCKEFIYQNVADVYEQGMATEDFLAAYSPVGKASPMQEGDLEGVLVTEGGAMYINCPSCKGNKSLEIIPARSTKKESPSVSQGSPLAGITSINPGQFGG